MHLVVSMVVMMVASMVLSLADSSVALKVDLTVDHLALSLVEQTGAWTVVHLGAQLVAMKVVK